MVASIAVFFFIRKNSNKWESTLCNDCGSYSSGCMLVLTATTLLVIVEAIQKQDQVQISQAGEWWRVYSLTRLTYTDKAFANARSSWWFKHKYLCIYNVIHYILKAISILNSDFVVLLLDHSMERLIKRWSEDCIVAWLIAHNTVIVMTVVIPNTMIAQLFSI